MTDRWRLVLAILIYLTLDLSHPAMPGAFEFEPADSAESTQVRARAAAKAVMLSDLAHGPGFVLFQPPLEVDARLARISSTEWRARPIVGWRSRVHDTSALPSEDPH